MERTDKIARIARSRKRPCHNLSAQCNAQERTQGKTRSPTLHLSLVYLLCMFFVSIRLMLMLMAVALGLGLGFELGFELGLELGFELELGLGFELE